MSHIAVFVSLSLDHDLKEVSLCPTPIRDVDRPIMPDSLSSACVCACVRACVRACVCMQARECVRLCVCVCQRARVFNAVTSSFTVSSNYILYYDILSFIKINNLEVEDAQAT